MTPTEQLCQAVNDSGFTAEIVRGQVVVMPWSLPENGYLIDELMNLLHELKIENRWRMLWHIAIHIPPDLDMRLPDLIVAPRAPKHFDKMRLSGDGTLLVVEVCSEGTSHVNRGEKAHEYARAGVPLYLIVDPTVEPNALVLMSEPVEGRRVPYQQVQTVHRGGKLRLPAPFELEIDTEALFSAAESPR